ncbi:MAG: flagellar hook-basal body complex protein FliE [Chloroflexi bacterium]|jgi:flagellar hook-basal body complex protein FliE|nr:flagellar hook-basal body complex protein FliE [Chloroflexota bacterium]BCY17946.1 flagellar hook-basal body complex protein FliE [Leptolinea sp. HRD-7]
MNIQGINSTLASQVTSSAKVNRQDTIKEVGKTFDSLLQSLNQTQVTSDDLMSKLAAGEDVDIHQVMIAADQADISFKIAIGIRDKLVDAYKEISRMSV